MRGERSFQTIASKGERSLGSDPVSVIHAFWNDLNQTSRADFDRSMETLPPGVRGISANTLAALFITFEAVN